MDIKGLWKSARLHMAHNVPERGPYMKILHGPCLRVLIVYYSYTGNTRTVAQMMRERTCGVLYGVEPLEPYDTASLEKTTQCERDRKTFPVLRYAPPLMTHYDFILVGCPVWHQSLPAPLRSFLHQTDFTGKRVAPFCTYEKGAGNFFADFAMLAKNADLLRGFAFDISRYHFVCESAVLLDASLAALGIPSLRCVAM